MKKNIKIFVLVIVLWIFMLFIGANNSFAIDVTLEDKSEAYKQWESRTEEERMRLYEPLPFNMSVKDSIKRSTYNQMLSLAGANIIPSDSYNLKDDLQNIYVRDQLKTSTCWAFSFAGTVNMSMQKQRMISQQYSPMHIEYRATQMFARNVGDGGNQYMALAYSTSGNGPVLEEDMPFSEYYDESNPPSYMAPLDEIDVPTKTPEVEIDNATIFDGIYKTYQNGQVTSYHDGNNTETYSDSEVKAIRNLIKQHIMEYGPLAGLLYSDIGIDQSGNYVSPSYNSSTAAYYTNDASEVANHATIIVGWDDNYSVDNFRSDKKPKNPGAYIVLNSYGENFGEGGFYYISYDDAIVETSLIGLTSVNDEINYDKIYQYNELGMNQSISLGDAGTIYGGNKFTREQLDDKVEYITSVGVYLSEAEGLEIYINSEDDNIPNSKLVCTPGALEAGYHNIALPSPIELTGDKFAIAIKYTNQEGASLPIEANLKESNFAPEGNMYDSAKSGSNQSFFSPDGAHWQELNDTSAGEDIVLKNTDTCIKVFTRLADKPKEINVEGVSLDKQSITLTEGETDTLTATITPDNATNKNITWSTSNPDVASVQNGVVTANSAGTATITVTTEDGNKTAQCQVTVIQKPIEIIHVQGVSLDKTNITLTEGETDTLTATVMPDDATNKNITWSTSNPDVVSVQNGVVTANSAGTATITVTTEDGNKTATCQVTVEERPVQIIHVEEVSLNKEKDTLEIGNTTNLNASITPSDATNQKIIWTSSNPDVATVNDYGVIKALKEGTTIITATSEDGNISDSCEITVIKKTNTDDDIYQDDDQNTGGNNTNTGNNSNNNSATSTNNTGNSANSGNNDNSENRDDGNMNITVGQINQGNSPQVDNTISNISRLPNTGATWILIFITLIILIFGIVKFIEYRNLKDVK